MKQLSKYTQPFLKTKKLPTENANPLLRLREKFVPRGVYNSIPIFIHRGEGAFIEDVDGNIFLDFVGGIGSLNIGYSNPELIDILEKQLKKYFHTSFHSIQYDSYIQLAQKLSEITPGDFPKKSMFVNSGAEAVENAIKIAKKYTKRSGIICFEGAFHGRTHLTMALTSKVNPYNAGYGPFMPGIYKIPFAYCYRCAYGLEYPTCQFRCAQRLEEVFASVVSPDEVAVVILEPIQGEGGFILPPDGFVEKIKTICEKYQILLIADEVQTGMCRTGKMFASEYWQVAPDLITTAKSLSAGIPLGGVTGRAEVMDGPEIGEIGTTFGGNPLACVAALKVIEIMQRDGFADKALALGKSAQKRFDQMQKKYELIGQIRGKGTMLALELVKDRKTKQPATDETKAIIREAFQQGLLIFSAGLYSNCIRLLLPLVVTEDQLQNGIDILDKAFKKITD